MSNHRVTERRSDWKRTARIAALLLPAAVLLAAACGPRGKAAAPYDLKFIDAMIAHHQAAVDMATPADSNALQLEIKDFARRVAIDQSNDIELLRQWRRQWFPDQPETLSAPGMPGMAAPAKDPAVERLRALRGADYDRAFIELMIPHHQAAIAMAKEALGKATHQELKDLAQRIIDIQGVEIEMMNRWKSQSAGGK